MDANAAKFADNLFGLSHDEQFLLIQKQETEFLHNVLFAASSLQEFYIEEMRKIHNDDYLRLVVESTYTYVTITTVLRGRGAYGSSVNICPHCDKPFLPGETLTSDISENVCHFDCEDPKLERKIMYSGKITMFDALIKLSLIRKTKDRTYVENDYHKMFTIGEKLLSNSPELDFPQDLIITLGGIYRSHQNSNEMIPIYTVVC